MSKNKKGRNKGAKAQQPKCPTIASCERPVEPHYRRTADFEQRRQRLVMADIACFCLVTILTCGAGALMWLPVLKKFLKG